MARVLVVDDNDTMREGMAVTLQKSGHQVLAFRGGAEAIALVQGDHQVQMRDHRLGACGAAVQLR